MTQQKKSSSNDSRYIEMLVFLLKESQTLVHLNLFGCFPGVQVKQHGEYAKFLPHPKNIIGSDNSKLPLAICEISCLFEAVSRSKSL